MGIVDTLGNEIIPLIYDDVEDFCQGLARVQKDGKWYQMNKMGKKQG